MTHDHRPVRARPRRSTRRRTSPVSSCCAPAWSATSTSTSTASRPIPRCCATSPTRWCRSCPTAPRRSRASSSVASRSPPCCRSSPASLRSSCARRRRPTAPASWPRAAMIDGTRLTVVEDVVTSGGQVITSCGDLRDRGAIVEHALCVIDRESGGPEGLAGIGVELHPLFTMTELEGGGGLIRPARQVTPRPRQGGVRGGSKSQGRTSPSMAANASSPQRSMPATGQGRLCRSKNPTARVSSGWPCSSPPIMRQWNSSEYSGNRANPRRRPSSTAMSDERLDLDAGLLVDLLDRDLARRVADVGVADRVEPHPGVGALGEQELAAARWRRSRPPRPSGSRSPARPRPRCSATRRTARRPRLPRSRRRGCRPRPSAPPRSAPSRRGSG